MGEPEPMTLSERRKYLRLLQPSYRSASRRERSRLLDEAQRVTRQHRKSLIRLLRSNLERKPRSRPRGRSYGLQVEYAVRLVARTLDFPCAERLQPALVSTASSLAGHGDLELSADLLERLERISISTVGRMVQRALAPAASAGVRRDGHQPRLARTRPSPPNPLTRSIPAGRLPRHLPGPGYFEADLVHHAGNATAGQYVHTLQLIDVATGWSERAAILGRSYTVMHTVPAQYPLAPPARAGALCLHCAAHRPGVLPGGTRGQVCPCGRTPSNASSPACRSPFWNSTPTTAASSSTAFS